MNYFFFVITLLIYVNSKETTFQEKLFLNIYEDNRDNNIMISPFIIYQVLSLLSNGAKGETQKEILEVIASKEEVENDNEILYKINKNFGNILYNLSTLNVEQLSNENISNQQENKNIIDSMNTTKPIYEISDNDLLLLNKNNNKNLIFYKALALFYNKKYSVEESFKLTCEAYNSSIAELKDANQINEFVYNNTNGKIKKIIDYIESDISFIIINTIYFKGYWVYPFIKDFTKKRIFENNDNSLVEVDTLYRAYEDIEYYEDDNVQMIALPYLSKNLRFKMIIILPNRYKFSSAFDYIKNENINYKDLISKIHKIKKGTVHLYLPKFKTEFDIELIDQLKKMNMNLSFTRFADFSKIVKQNSFISQIKHKTYIEIDEEGTEAIAALDLSGSLGGGLPKEYYMYVNHSFIYTIISEDIKDHNGNYLMPFIGAINKLSGNIIKNNGLNIADNYNNINDL